MSLNILFLTCKSTKRFVLNDGIHMQLPNNISCGDNILFDFKLLPVNSLATINCQLLAEIIFRTHYSLKSPASPLFTQPSIHAQKKTSKLRVTGFSWGNSLVTSEFPAQMASNAENVSI